MYEDVGVTSGAAARLVQQRCPAGLQAVNSGGKIVNAQGDVMQAGSALLDESRDRRCGRR